MNVLLVVEDNAADQRIILEAFKALPIPPVELKFVDDGQAVLDYLKNTEEKPALIFLDLNLPKKDGREVIAEIKADEALRHIPVIVLTSSKSEHDISTCYRLNANSYLIKPATFTELLELMRLVHDYWFTKVVYPEPAPEGEGQPSKAAA